MNPVAIVTILYLVVVLVVGYFASRKRAGGGVREFLVAGGQLPWILLMPLLMAELVTANTTVALAEYAHKSGIDMLWFYIGSSTGLILLGFVFAKFYASLKKVTLGEMFATLFDRRTRLTCVITMISLSTMSAGVGYLGLGTIIAPLFNTPYITAIWISTALVVILSIIGLRGLAWMNVVHFLTILVCFGTVAIMAIASVGGPVKLFTSLPAEHLNPLGVGLPTIIAWIVSAVALKLVSTVTIVAIFAARSETDAKLGTVATGIFVLIFAAIPMVIGLCAYIIMPDIDSRHALYAMGEHLGPVASSMVSIGVLAAIISSYPAFLLSLAGLFTRDLFLLAKPNCSEKGQLFVCRLAIVFIAVVATVIAITLVGEGSILSYSRSVMQVRVVLVVPVIISILWRRVHPTAAFWAILTGVMSGFPSLIASQVLHINVPPLWPALGVGLTTLFIVSLVKKPAPYKGTEGLEAGGSQ